MAAVPLGFESVQLAFPIDDDRLLLLRERVKDAF
jgi:hypothetical protein